MQPDAGGSTISSNNNNFASTTSASGAGKKNEFVARAAEVQRAGAPMRVHCYYKTPTEETSVDNRAVAKF